MVSFASALFGEECVEKTGLKAKGQYGCTGWPKLLFFI